MSSGLAFRQISKRKFTKLSAVAVFPAALVLPSVAYAQQQQQQAQQAQAQQAQAQQAQTPDIGAPLSHAEAGKMVESSQNLGMIIMLHYDGTIRARPVGNGNVQQWDEDSGETPPPVDEDNIIEEATANIIIYTGSPGCVRTKLDGQTVQICE